MPSFKETSNENDSGDDQVLETEHTKLLSAVLQLDGKQRIKPAVRKEFSQEISEFNLGKTKEKHNIKIYDLTKSLEKRAAHAGIGKKLRSIRNQAKTLRRPLEQTESDRIKRVVGFSNVKKQVSKWGAVVHRNRVADNLAFPLASSDTVNIDTTRNYGASFRTQSELEAKIAEVLNGSKVVKEEREAAAEEFSLSLEELMERRKELARLRAQQSYRESKAYRQKKIKSKSYHRILRKQRLKQQINDFEQLQKTDPEAALKQLELLERNRAKERVTLRHRNTGKWAKNQAVHAKYNEQARKELAEQLTISRDLTKKVQVDGSSDDDCEDEIVEKCGAANADNPWVSDKNISEVDKFVESYREFWNKTHLQNKSDETDLENQKSMSEAVNRNVTDSSVSTERNCVENQGSLNNTQIIDSSLSTESNCIENQDSLKNTQIIDTSLSTEKICIDNQDKLKNIQTLDSNKIRSPTKKGKMTAAKRKKLKADIIKQDNTRIVGTTDSWEVTTLSSDIELRPNCKSNVVDKKSVVELDDMFTTMEENIKSKAKNKLQQHKNAVNKLTKETKSPELSIKGKNVSLQFKQSQNIPIIDEPLLESASRTTLNTGIKEKNLIDDNKISTARIVDDIDPSKFISVKSKSLKSGLPNLADADEAIDDEDDDQEKQLTISEAFAGDDVVEEFRKEKEETTEKSKLEDIDLSLPGWGSWGGHGMLPSSSKRKRKRFLIKAPPVAPRKDANKGDVIINEEKDKKIREHQVNELPFPFTSVADFEASVRAPIGGTFVPQRAHQKLIKPKYVTKAGKVIKPMNEESVLKKRQSVKIVKSANKKITEKS